MDTSSLKPRFQPAPTHRLTRMLVYPPVRPIHRAVPAHPQEVLERVPAAGAARQHMMRLRTRMWAGWAGGGVRFAQAAGAVFDGGAGVGELAELGAPLLRHRLERGSFHRSKPSRFTSGIRCVPCGEHHDACPDGVSRRMNPPLPPPHDGHALRTFAETAGWRTSLVNVSQLIRPPLSRSHAPPPHRRRARTCRPVRTG